MFMNLQLSGSGRLHTEWAQCMAHDRHHCHTWKSW